MEHCVQASPPQGMCCTQLDFTAISLLCQHIMCVPNSTHCMRPPTHCDVSLCVGQLVQQRILQLLQLDGELSALDDELGFGLFQIWSLLVHHQGQQLVLKTLLSHLQGRHWGGGRERGVREGRGVGRDGERRVSKGDGGGKKHGCKSRTGGRRGWWGDKGNE